jgi:hypothetical protein
MNSGQLGLPPFQKSGVERLIGRNLICLLEEIAGNELL